LAKHAQARRGSQAEKRAVADCSALGWIITESFPHLAPAAKQAFLYSSIMPVGSWLRAGENEERSEVASVNASNEVRMLAGELQKRIDGAKNKKPRDSR